MAEASRRDQEKKIRLSETQMRQPGMEDIAALKSDDSGASDANTSELAQEYGYVLSDLRRIGVIALVMLGVLVGLALLLA